MVERKLSCVRGRKTTFWGDTVQRTKGKVLISILSVLTLYACGCEFDDSELYSEVMRSKIVGGDTVDIYEYPWQVALQWKYDTGPSQFCAGSIINESWVVTATHCTDGRAPSKLQIAAGITNVWDRNGQERDIEYKVEHPEYTYLDHDIALLRLAAPLDLSAPNVSAIPIVTQELAIQGFTDAGMLATVSGWGTLGEDGPWTDLLHAVNVTLVTDEEVEAVWGDVTDTEIGAGNMYGEYGDSCYADSGGPLVVPDGSGGKLLAGIVSYGRGCANQGWPGMYARVSYFAKWIKEHVNNPSVPDDSIDEDSLSSRKGHWKHFSMKIPKDAAKLIAKIRGGSGDADLYIRHKKKPNKKKYYCRPYVSGNTESCKIKNPNDGIWYVSLYADEKYAGVKLTSRYKL